MEIHACVYTPGLLMENFCIYKHAIWLLFFGATLWWWQYLRRYRFKAVLDNLPGPPPQSFMRGNTEQYYHRHGADFHREVAMNYGPIVRLHGLCGNPILYVSDPKALHTMMIKEDDVYEEADIFLITNYLLVGPGLTATLGDAHRKQRKMMNPAFSINHMRRMLPLFYNTAHRLRDAIIAQVRGCPKEIDMVSWMGRTALEIIGQVGLGHSFDPLTADSDNKYGDALKSLTSVISFIFCSPQIDQVHELRRALPYIYWWGPAWFRRWMLKMVPNKHVQNAIPIVDVMDRKSREIFEAKVAAMEGGEETVLRQVEEGKDIMSILIKANNAASETDRLSSEEIIAQMSTFVFAATDSTSNTLARILQLLALHPEIQEKLRKEILEAHAGDHLPYDELASLPLLDAVCRETLRVYPPGTTLTREPRKDVVMPLSEPIRGRDGKMISEVPIPKGTEIIVGTIGINCSKALWGEDASEWRPERWLSPLPDALSKARVPGVYSNLMTFHGGKRACIGFKFSETEMKCIMSVLLTNFIFELSNKPIYWNVAGAWYPSVGKDSDQPQMPLKVSMYGGGSSG